MTDHPRLLALLAVLLALPPAAQAGLAETASNDAARACTPGRRSPAPLLAVSLNAPRQPP